MNYSRFGVVAGLALLLAAPALAQSAEPPAGSTPPAPADMQKDGQKAPAPQYPPAG